MWKFRVIILPAKKYYSERYEMNEEKQGYRGCTIYAPRYTARLHIPEELCWNLDGCYSTVVRLFTEAFGKPPEEVVPNHHFVTGWNCTAYWSIILPRDGDGKMLNTFVDSLYDNQKKS
jgi:hypothetical protein